MLPPKMYASKIPISIPNPDLPGKNTPTVIASLSSATNSRLTSVTKKATPYIQPEDLDPALGLANLGGLDDKIKWFKMNTISDLEVQTCLKEEWGYETEKGVILYGPPGTGKTMLVKAYAAEELKNGRKVTLFICRGPELLGQYIGQSEVQIRELFQAVIARKPAILFLDEMDALCSKRTEKTHQSFVNIVTALLGEMDRLKRGEVLVIGATNRIDNIDPAFKRPGRFGKHLEFLPPNEKGRLQILEIYTKKWKKNPPSKEFLTDIAKNTSGSTGADLENLVRNAFSIALERCQLLEIPIKEMEVTPEDWQKALKIHCCSNSNVFGFSFAAGLKLSSQLLPLLEGVSNEIKTALDQIYSESTYLPDFTQQLLVILTESKSAFSILNDYIIPHVLAETNSDQIRTFELKYIDILWGSERERLKEFRGLFDKIQSAKVETVMLVIPQVDQLWNSFPVELQDEIKTLMRRIQNKRIIILATAICSEDRFEGINWLNKVAYVKMRRPNDEEMLRFFMKLDLSLYFELEKLTEELAEEIEKFLIKCSELIYNKETIEVENIMKFKSKIQEELGKYFTQTADEDDEDEKPAEDPADEDEVDKASIDGRKGILEILEEILEVFLKSH